jgi:hypothetical protein
MVTEQQKAQIAAQDQLSEDDLMKLLGEQHGPKLIGAAEANDHEKIAQGRSFWARKRSEIQGKICGAEFRKTLANASVGRVALIVAVADALTGLYTGVSLVTISVLVVKEGLDDFCGPVKAAQE